MTTVKSNLKEMEQGINYFALPATFQDAIAITRNLGVRYLWIDSLCIMQDSPEDWLTEAANMPNIYRNACVTVAAAASNTSKGGLFVDRSWTSQSKPCQLPIPHGKGHGTIHFDVPFDAMIEEQTNILLTRAWCLQESLLSPRVLLFDKLQL